VFTRQPRRHAPTCAHPYRHWENVLLEIVGRCRPVCPRAYTRHVHKRYEYVHTDNVCAGNSSCLPRLGVRHAPCLYVWIDLYTVTRRVAVSAACFTVIALFGVIRFGRVARQFGDHKTYSGGGVQVSLASARTAITHSLGPGKDTWRTKVKRNTAR